jgi:hypothetical protein
MFLPFAIIILVLESQVFASIHKRQNSSTTSATHSASKTTSPASSSSSHGDCCAIIANGVGLNIWYNKSVEITVATIVTQLLHYDNTVITSLHTVTNNASASWTAGEYPAGELTVSGVPTDLVATEDDGGYEATSIATDTGVTFDGTIVFVILSAIEILLSC